MSLAALSWLRFYFPVLAGFVLLAGCQRTSAPQAARVLCGSSMAEPMRKVTAAFESAGGTPIEMDIGGSETFLPKVLAGASAEVLICHDPFEEKIRAAGRAAGETAVVGWLCPIVVVAPGNPKRISDWQSLATPGLRLGIGDPRYSTCGEMFVAELRRRGLEGSVMKNVVVQARSHGELANALLIGSLDAASVWNFVAGQYRGKLETAPLAADWPEIRVTAVGLSSSQRPEIRDALLEWCRRGATKDLFAEYGYTRPGH